MVICVGEAVVKRLLSNYTFARVYGSFTPSLMADAPRNTDKAPQIGGCYSDVPSPGLGLSAGHPPAEGDVSHSRKPKVTDARMDVRDLSGVLRSFQPSRWVYSFVFL